MTVAPGFCIQMAVGPMPVSHNCNPRPALRNLHDAGVVVKERWDGDKAISPQGGMGYKEGA